MEYERSRLALRQEGKQSAATTDLIRRLERELARTEKPLAEAAAQLGYRSPAALAPAAGSGGRTAKKNAEEQVPRRGRRHSILVRRAIGKPVSFVTSQQKNPRRLARACSIEESGSEC